VPLSGGSFVAAFAVGTFTFRLIPGALSFVVGSAGVAESVLRRESSADICSPEPDLRSPEPDLRSPEPGVRSPEPDLRSPEPDVRSPEPGVRSPEPGVRSPEPGVRSPEPGVRSPEPDVPPARFRRGDTNADGDVNLTDAVFTPPYLFRQGSVSTGKRARLSRDR
jgi:hypothetical protein